MIGIDGWELGFRGWPSSDANVEIVNYLYRRHQVFPSLLRMVNDNRRTGKGDYVNKNEMLNNFNSSFEGDGNTG